MNKWHMPSPSNLVHLNHNVKLRLVRSPWELDAAITLTPLTLNHAGVEYTDSLSVGVTLNWSPKVECRRVVGTNRWLGRTQGSGNYIEVELEPVSETLRMRVVEVKVYKAGARPSWLQSL